MGSRRRLLPLGIAAVGLAVYFFLSPRLPIEQAIRIILGDASPRVGELVVRYVAVDASGTGSAGGTSEPLREVTFRYAPGSAPRIVSHEPRLPNGDYIVQMELSLIPPGTPTSGTPTSGTPTFGTPTSGTASLGSPSALAAPSASVGPQVPVAAVASIAIARRVSLQGGTTSIDVSRSLLHPADEP